MNRSKFLRKIMCMVLVGVMVTMMLPVTMRLQVQAQQTGTTHDALVGGIWEFVAGGHLTSAFFEGFHIEFMSRGDLDIFGTLTTDHRARLEPFSWWAYWSVVSPGRLDVTITVPAQAMGYDNWIRVEHFTYSISGNILTITDQAGNTNTYRR